MLLQTPDMIQNATKGGFRKKQDFKNGAFIDGYLSFVDDKSNIISFPFASFKGDFDRLSMVEKPLYEFDFNTEHPMYWNYNFEDNPWHKFSTHIETNVNGKEVGVNCRIRGCSVSRRKRSCQELIGI